MSKTNWIAEQSFRCVRRTGETFDLTVRISEPMTVKTSGLVSSIAKCHISLEPLASNKSGSGGNKFQVLCLALDHIRAVFKVFLADGGRIYWEDTDSHIDIESTWFAPMFSMAELTKDSKSNPRNTSKKDIKGGRSVRKSKPNKSV
jgi:hypothetical protein